MAVTQSQYNFVKFAATGDALNFKGLLAGFIITKANATTVGKVRIQNYAKTMEIVPLTTFNSAAQPVTVINFPEFGIPVTGLHVTVCSNMAVVAMRR
jgi:hypothetical protein